LILKRRDVGVVDRARLESVCRGNSPSLRQLTRSAEPLRLLQSQTRDRPFGTKRAGRFTRVDAPVERRKMEWRNVAQRFWRSSGS